MGILAWTFSCLTLLSLMSYALFYSLVDHHLLNKYLSAHVQEVDKTTSSLYLEDTRMFYDTAKVPIEPPQRIVASERVEKRPRLTSKLHITPSTFTSLRSQGGSSEPVNPRDRIVYNLLKQHYPGIGDYTGQSDSDTMNSLLEAISEAVTRYEGMCSYKDARILANFELQNKKLQEPYWQILAGKDENEECWSPFLSFISFHQNRQMISLWLAPKPLLRAMFDDKSDEDIEAFIAKRYQLFKGVKKNSLSGETDSRSSSETEFRALCEKMLPSWLPSSEVDLAVSTTPPKR